MAAGLMYPGLGTLTTTAATTENLATVVIGSAGLRYPGLGTLTTDDVKSAPGKSKGAAEKNAPEIINLDINSQALRMGRRASRMQTIHESDTPHSEIDDP